jgi:hypothetical protein
MIEDDSAVKRSSHPLGTNSKARIINATKER